MSDSVILVDENDEELGIMEKLDAHRKGALHRAFSIFIFNSKGEMLLQKRSSKKYHTANLWSNACCSHPQLDEEINTSLQRKLNQEMGFTCALNYAFRFTYRSELDNGLIEYEIDHIYVGKSDTIPKPNPDEVCDWKYSAPAIIAQDMQRDPSKFTPWFKMLFEPVMEHFRLVH